MRTLVLTSMLAAATSACTPYSPDLGAAPFKCGPLEQSPRCPDGYTCIPQAGSNAPEVCIQNGGDGTIPDSGTGACAAVAVGRRHGRLGAHVEVALPDGRLVIDWPGEGQALWMTGPAVESFRGQVEV